jgi:hypothetical protein
MHARQSPAQRNGTPRIASILAAIRVFGAMCYTQRWKPAGAITMAVQQKLYTADDLWALSHAGDDKWYELDEGELIEMSPTGDTHGELSLWISHSILGFVIEHDAPNCFDNAPMESFWGKLKTECLYRHPFATRAEARSIMFAYLEGFYNRQRLLSTLGYQSPQQFEQAF